MGPNAFTETPHPASRQPLGAFALGDEVDRDVLVESLAAAICRQVKQADREDVKKIVNEKYGELHEHATVTKHIAALVEGMVKRHFREGGL